MTSFPLGGVVRDVLSLGRCGARHSFPWEVWCATSFLFGGVVTSFPLGGVVRDVLSLGRCGARHPFPLEVW